MCPARVASGRSLTFALPDSFLREVAFFERERKEKAKKKGRGFHRGPRNFWSG